MAMNPLGNVPFFDKVLRDGIPGTSGGLRWNRPGLDDLGASQLGNATKLPATKDSRPSQRWAAKVCDGAAEVGLDKMRSSEPTDPDIVRAQVGRAVRIEASRSPSSCCRSSRPLRSRRARKTSCSATASPTSAPRTATEGGSTVPSRGPEQWISHFPDYRLAISGVALIT